MRPLLFSAVLVGAGWVTLTPAMATSIGLTGFNGLTPSATPIQKVGYWKRQYRRHGYPAPYAYYPPAYGYYPPPIVYAYPPAVYGYQPPRLPMPILHRCMAMRHLHLPPVRRQRRTTATIRLLTETTQQRRASTPNIRRMAISAYELRPNGPPS